MPPTSASGMFDRISSALFTEPKAWNSSRKIRKTLIGTMMRKPRHGALLIFEFPAPFAENSRAAARRSRRTLRCISSTALPMSRSAQEHADGRQALAVFVRDVHARRPGPRVWRHLRAARAGPVARRSGPARWRPDRRAARSRSRTTTGIFSLALPDLGGLLAAERGLDDVLHIGDVQAVARARWRGRCRSAAAAPGRRGR